MRPAAPAFDAAYAATLASPVRAESDTMVTILPAPASIIGGSAARVACITPNRLTPTNPDHAARACSMKGCRSPIPMGSARRGLLDERLQIPHPHGLGPACVARVVHDDVVGPVPRDRGLDGVPVGDVE